MKWYWFIIILLIVGLTLWVIISNREREHILQSVRSGSYYTDKTIIKNLYKAMFYFHRIMINNDIFYCIEGGTLLGAVRHKGIIPWDNDIDVDIWSKDVPKIASKKVIDEAKSYGYTIKKTQYGYWKFVSDIGGVQIDIFPIIINKEGKTKYDYSNTNPWSKCYFDKDELLPLKHYQFANMIVLGPNNPNPYLERCYGKDWNKVGYITQGKGHHLLNKPIKLEVTDFKPAYDFFEF